MNEPQIIIYKGKVYWGFKKCPAWLKSRYIAAVEGKCQDCKQEKPLEPHRIKRGCENGLYTAVPLNHPISNVKMLCHKCHEKYNYSRKVNYSL
jgi:hypothetical protein